MARRYTIPFAIQNLFGNMPIETGRTDADNIFQAKSPMPLKTFAHLRKCPPSSMTAKQILLVARLVQRHTPFSAADVFAMARSGDMSGRTGLWTMAIAQTQSRSPKDVAYAERQIQSLLPEVRRIYLFDRSDSFAYCRPMPEEKPLSDPDEPAVGNTNPAFWSDTFASWRYDRRPRISVTLTAGSLYHRTGRYADSGIEQLIGNVESGNHSLTIVRDDVRVAHRVFGGVFSDSAAVAIFDAKRMVVLPSHGNALRTYDAQSKPLHRVIINEAVRQLRIMRRFRAHRPDQAGVIDYLRRLLSYTLPTWRRV